ncbi:hypothetical protein O1611_g10279 [Lasiodiplodia mahajangana]|uniref:Uncharacterized protein n=1 Tax=Lasiodiplodia mahajangana TaxID=1108764 RepID=A0ACC2J006_9PEZI|nr:hypothetical protein O1611_g10279 [Lasiodiplodia mahajangana]
MEASAIGAAVLFLATTDISKASHGTAKTRLGTFSNSDQMLELENAGIESKKRDARKIRQLEAQIDGYKQFLKAVGKAEQPSKQGLHGPIDPKWVHGLDIAPLFNKKHLFDKLAIVFDPAEREFAVLNRAVLYMYTDDYEEIDLPYYNFPLDTITIFRENILGSRETAGGAETISKWAFTAKARSRPYEDGIKGAREKYITFPLTSLGWAVILQRRLHRIQKLHVLKARPIQRQEVHEHRGINIQEGEPNHGVLTSNEGNAGEGEVDPGLYHLARRMVTRILLTRDRIAAQTPSETDLDTAVNQALGRIRRVQLERSKKGCQLEELTGLHFEGVQALAELVAGGEEVKAAARHLLETAQERETKIIRDILKQNEGPLQTNLNPAIELWYAAQQGMSQTVQYLLSSFET